MNSVQYPHANRWDASMITVLYHANCLDGFAAALAAWMKYHEHARYIAVHPDAPLPGNMEDYRDHDVYMLDTCLDPNAIEQLELVVRSLTVLDHHESQFHRWKNHSCRCTGGFTFDLQASGATMAWVHFHPDTNVPWFMRYIQIADRWDWDDEPRAKAFAAYLQTQIPSFEEWSTWLNMEEHDPYVERACQLGQETIQKMDRECDMLMQHAMPVTLGKERGWMLNYTGPYRSELGHRLSKRNNTFGLVWRVGCDDHQQAKVFVSLRSEAPYDVRTLAEAFGGAGHPQAAGISMDLDTWANIFRLFGISCGNLRIDIE